MNKIILIVTSLCFTGCTTSRSIKNEPETSFVEKKDTQKLAPFERAIMSSPLKNQTYEVIALDAWSLTVEGVTYNAPEDEHAKHTSVLLKSSFISSYFKRHSIESKDNLVLKVSKYTPKIYLHVLLSELDKSKSENAIYIAVEDHKNRYLIHPNYSFPNSAIKNMLTYSSVHVNQCSEIFTAEARNEVDTVKKCYESNYEYLDAQGLIEVVVGQDNQIAISESDLPSGIKKCLVKMIDYLKQFQRDDCIF